jgi:hypothetical protein
MEFESAPPIHPQATQRSLELERCAWSRVLMTRRRRLRSPEGIDKGAIISAVVGVVGGSLLALGIRYWG